MKRIGVDTGGTFTDVVSATESGELQLHKLLSTPDDPGRALRDGVSLVGADAGDLLVHGTTVATNALLERRGARVALITTAGFESLLQLGRQARPELYDLQVEATAPLVRADDVFGLAERIAFDGEVLEPLTDEELVRMTAWLRAEEFESVAICLLHAYANSTHEEQVEAAVHALSAELHVSRSSTILPEFREFERASTTSVNAYVGPVMSSYLRRIDEELSLETIDIFLSSGGRANLAEAASEPVHTVLSGPAGGVVGALAAAKEVGIEAIVSFDMGGTSTDVSLARGSSTISRDATIGGIPIGVPVVDIETVGAGGGSIAWRDPGGALRVGPRSAGADPGPACYGRGGTEPTVTDAHLYLGRLRPDRFLGGSMTLDVEAARTAIERLAADFSMSGDELANGILQVADAEMVRAIKVVSLERGDDPGELTLVSFGGAGGLHATRLAEELGMSRVLIPNQPGLLSAWGMLHAPRQWTASRSVMTSADDVDTIRRAAEHLKAEAARRLPDADSRVSLALRYVGQSFEIEVLFDCSDTTRPIADFEERHEDLYGYRADRDVECTVVRVDARDPLPTLPGISPTVESKPSSRATVAMRGVAVDAAIIERDTLKDGAKLAGPLVLTELSGTTVVPAGWALEVKRGHLLMSDEAAQ